MGPSRAIKYDWAKYGMPEMIKAMEASQSPEVKEALERMKRDVQ